MMQKVKEIITGNRVKSLLWRSAMMGLAFLFAEAVEVVEWFNPGTDVTVLTGLVFGEISKALNRAATGK